jgi:hypothetical protein
MDDDLGVQVVKHPPYLSSITELIVMVRKWDDSCRAVFLQSLDNVSAQEALTPRDNNLLVGEVEHGYFISLRMLSPV